MRLLFLCLSLCLVVACGQKGALYLPEKQAPTTPPQSQP